MDIKKFLSIFVICAAVLFSSTCNAAQVRLSNIDAETFLNKMAVMLNTETMKKACPIAITTLKRDEKGDLSDYGLTAWAALFASDESTPAEGYVNYFVDSSGYVDSMKFVFKINSNWADKYRNLMLSALWTLDFTPEQAAQLIKGGTTTQEGVYYSELRIDEHRKNYVIILTSNNDTATALLLATDGKNE